MPSKQDRRPKGKKKGGLAKSYSRGKSTAGRNANSAGEEAGAERRYKDKLVQQSSDQYGNFGKGGERGLRSDARKAMDRDSVRRSQERMRFGPRY